MNFFFKKSVVPNIISLKSVNGEVVSSSSSNVEDILL